MIEQMTRTRGCAVVLMILPLVTATRVYGVGGVIDINQARAIAGNVTPGDAPGFPVSITQSGSYRLAGNLTVSNANTAAIVVVSNEVTIDLNGFTISGPVSCTTSTAPAVCTPSNGTGQGVVSENDFVTVRNGTVRGMGEAGIKLTGRSPRVEGLRVTSNGGSGIATSQVLSLAASITDCAALSNGGDGIDAGSMCVVMNNTVQGNGVQGINTGESCVVTNNTASYNGGLGFGVISGTVLGNTARFNGSHGLSLGGGAYGSNFFDLNNGGNANPQVVGGIQVGTNVCGTSACP